MNINGKKPYLNFGCGGKYHRDWVNLDMHSNSPDVLAHNLLEGIPFPDGQFEAVYHSQVLEHFPKAAGEALMRECFRVLRPNGIVRVVLPDLEDIAREYLRLLEENLASPTERGAADYEWMLLELYDQAARNRPGGEMAEFLRRPALPNESFVYDRIGFVGRSIRERFLARGYRGESDLPQGWLRRTRYHLRKYGFGTMLRRLFLSAEEARRLEIGNFRLNGEIHYWMYDRYSLGELLRRIGFVDVVVKTPHTSDIPEFARYELDVKAGQPYDPTSLFIEARKP